MRPCTLGARAGSRPGSVGGSGTDPPPGVLPVPAAPARPALGVHPRDTPQARGDSGTRARVPWSSCSPCRFVSQAVQQSAMSGSARLRASSRSKFSIVASCRPAMLSGPVAGHLQLGVVATLPMQQQVDRSPSILAVIATSAACRTALRRSVRGPRGSRPAPDPRPGPDTPPDPPASLPSAPSVPPAPPDVPHRSALPSGTAPTCAPDCGIRCGCPARPRRTAPGPGPPGNALPPVPIGPAAPQPRHKRRAVPRPAALPPPPRAAALPGPPRRPLRPPAPPRS